jgi:hypothetical protein
MANIERFRVEPRLVGEHQRAGRSVGKEESSNVQTTNLGQLHCPSDTITPMVNATSGSGLSSNQNEDLSALTTFNGSDDDNYRKETRE